MVTIEKGIPIPTIKYNKSGYPFQEMEVGDSFFIQNRGAKSLYMASYFWRKGNGLNWRFKAVKEKDGSRIWRIK